MDARATTEPSASAGGAGATTGDGLVQERLHRVDELDRRRRAGGDLAEAVLAELLGELRALVEAVEPAAPPARERAADERGEGVDERPARRLQGT